MPELTDHRIPRFGQVWRRMEDATIVIVIAARPAEKKFETLGVNMYRGGAMSIDKHWDDAWVTLGPDSDRWEQLA